MTWSALASRLPNLDRVTPGNKKRVSQKTGEAFSQVPVPIRNRRGRDEEEGETKEPDVCNGPSRLICETPSSRPVQQVTRAERVVRRASTNHSKSVRATWKKETLSLLSLPFISGFLAGLPEGGATTHHHPRLFGRALPQQTSGGKR